MNRRGASGVITISNGNKRFNYILSTLNSKHDMKRFVLCALCAIALSATAQVSIPHQEIGYNVHYHWGPVDVHIAHGTVEMGTDGERFTATLDGNSIPWNGRVFCISDTLVADMSPQAGGLSRESVSYETGWYMKPKVREYRSGNFNPTDPANYRNIAGDGNLSASANTMEAITVTSDMLGMFYYFNEMDFENMARGTRTVIPIAGGYSTEVAVTYLGQNTYIADGVQYATYEVEFEYSYEGAMSGYEVHAQVAQEGRIPVLLSASLPVGHVEMIYDGF